MIVVGPGIFGWTFPNLVFGFFFGVFALPWQTRGPLQIEHLSFDLLDCVSNLDQRVDRPGHISHNIKQWPICVNFDHLLTEHGSTSISKLSRHFLTLDNFAREFTLTNGTRQTMRSTVSVRVVLLREVPPFDSTRSSLSNWDRTDVNCLADLEVTRAEHVADGQESFRWDRKFSQVSLRGQVVLQKVTDLRFFNPLDLLFATAYLNWIYAIFFECFDLGDLTAVQLNYSAGGQFSPLVPKVGHADFVADNSRALWISARGQSRF